MIVTIQIVVTQGHFHALDAIVKDGDTVYVSTQISNATFTVGVNNSDGFFTNLQGTSLPVSSGNSPVLIGDATANGAGTNYYKITQTSGTIIPPTTAPPRIIRVS